jgi:1-aminocyclopropane-1-carboxylate deaminase
LIKGNKYRKLKYNLEDISQARTVISFGGAYSNHIHALAALCQAYKVPVVGIIRGEDVYNDVLDFCRSAGMELHFTDRASYRKKEESLHIQQIINRYQQALIIPEGGSNDLALKGVGELIDEVVSAGHIFDYIAVAAGTGCTAAGLLIGMKAHGLTTKLLVFSALKGEWMADEIMRMSGIEKSKFYCTDKYSLGGYAKFNSEYINFISNFTADTNLVIDKVYNGKLLYALYHMDAQAYFKKGDKVLWVNSGGLT